MKNSKIIALAICLTAVTISESGYSKNTIEEKTTITVVDQMSKDKRSEALMLRLNEINNMDKSNLTRSEKRALRKEVLAIRHDGSGNGGIYLSVGAIIIIVLLLIILL